jgi:hypothetical protein
VLADTGFENILKSSALWDEDIRAEAAHPKELVSLSVVV